MKLSTLTEATYYDEVVTDDNFEAIKRDMVRKIEKAEGPDKHADVKRDIMSARSAQHLGDIMKAHIRKRGGAAARELGETLNESRGGADQWYRDILGFTIANAAEWGQQHPHSDPSAVVKDLVDKAMNEFNEGY